MSCASATTPNITHACSLFTKSAEPLATPRSTKRVASGSATLLRQRQALKLPTQRNDLDKPRTIDLHTGAPPPTKLSFGTVRLQYDCSLTFYLEGFGSIFYFTIYGHHQLIHVTMSFRTSDVHYNVINQYTIKVLAIAASHTDHA